MVEAIKKAALGTEQTIKAAAGVSQHICKDSKLEAKWSEFFVQVLIYTLICSFTFFLLWPLAHIRFLKWKYSKTIISGKRMNFEAKVSELYVKWIIWILLGTITFGIHTLLFLPVRYQQWHTSKLTLEGETGVSQFTGGVIEFFFTRMAAWVVSIFFFPIGLGIRQSMLTNFIYANRTVSGKEFKLHATGMGFMGMWAFWALLSVLSFGIWTFLALERAQWNFIVACTEIK